jgi:hypothetical protein
MKRLQLAFVTGLLICLPTIALGQSCPRPGLPMVIEYWSADLGLVPALADLLPRAASAENVPIADARFRHRLPSDWPAHWDESPDNSESTKKTLLTNDHDSDPPDPSTPDNDKTKRRSRSEESENELVVRDPFSGKYVPVSLSPKWGRPYDSDEPSNETESSQGSSQQLLAGNALSSTAGLSAPAVETQSIAPGTVSVDSNTSLDRKRYSVSGQSSSGSSSGLSAAGDTRDAETGVNAVATTEAIVDVGEKTSDPEGESTGGAAGGGAIGGLTGSSSRSVASADMGIGNSGSTGQAQRAVGTFGSSDNARGPQAMGSGAGGGGSGSSRSAPSRESVSGSDDGGFHQPTPPEPKIPDMLPEVPNEDPDTSGGHPGSPHSGLPGETPVVPEPGSLTLLSVALGCGTACWLRRRRKLNEQIPESVD